MIDVINFLYVDKEVIILIEHRYSRTIDPIKETIFFANCDFDGRPRRIAYKIGVADDS